MRRTILLVLVAVIALMVASATTASAVWPCPGDCVWTVEPAK